MTKATAVFWNTLLNVGITDKLASYESRRAKVFNVCNLAGFTIALIRFSYILFISPNHYTVFTLLINSLPLVICGIMALCMHYNQYRRAIMVSFIFFPASLTAMAVFTNDSGLEIYLLLYMMFTFFFLHLRQQILVTFCWVLACFVTVRFFLSPAIHFLTPGYNYPHDRMLTAINYISGLLFIFLTMYFIKFEVWKFEKSIREKKEELKKLNALKDKVFSVISHDLRTPVNSIILLLKSIEKVGLSAEDFKAYLPEIRNNMEQTGNLMNNLFTWARSQIQQTEITASEISITRLTEQTIRFLERNAAEKNIRIINEVTWDSFAFADENSAQIILRNLLANAIKFTGSGGSVKIKSENAGEFINVIIEDTGIGIPADKQELLFSDCYYSSPGTNRETGTGLGLLICRDLVQKNGGSLLFTSTEGKGSTFTFSLPNYN
jgi:two-component system, sensor histidine kinase and response regulator